ncbi:hypothetical protein ACJMK2_028405 [Sinanodonta woodiana]|uniref:Uncharacterized protein n=1 Tax=Sinanodonta woodiana TaxID=1069815 RepID=A0ABD3X710_SINWO
MWLATVLPVFVTICYDLGRYGSFYSHFATEPMIVLLIITGVLTLTSGMFAACGIWKSVRNLVLSARSSRSDFVDPNNRFLSTQQDEPLLTS